MKQERASEVPRGGGKGKQKDLRLGVILEEAASRMGDGAGQRPGKVQRDRLGWRSIFLTLSSNRGRPAAGPLPLA